MTDHGQKQSDVVEWVKASQAGDKTAFGRLVRLYQQQAMRLATGILGDAHDAAEVVQEAFVNAYLRLDRLRLPGRFGPWLLKAVANEAIDRRRTDLPYGWWAQGELDRLGCHRHERDHLWQTRVYDRNATVRSSGSRRPNSSSRAAPPIIGLPSNWA